MWGLGLPSFPYFAVLLSIQSLLPSATIPTPYQVTDLAPYVDSFLVESKIHGHPVEIPALLVSYIHNEWISEDTDVSCRPRAHMLGYCNLKDAVLEIAIDKDYWDGADYEEQLSLVFHELGHCVLHRRHKDDRILVGGRRIPVSLMNSTQEDEQSYFLEHFDFYMDELFNFESDQLLDP